MIVSNFSLVSGEIGILSKNSVPREGKIITTGGTEAFVTLCS